MQELRPRPAVQAARYGCRTSSAALSDLTWFIDMSRRIEERQIHRPNYPERLCLARLEGLPHDRGAMIRPGFDTYYLLYVELKPHRLNPPSFSPPIPGQKVH
jgi:hypothetical protein